MTVVDPALTPHRARRAVVRAVGDQALLLVALPFILRLPNGSGSVATLVVCLLRSGGGRSVEVWDALERPDRGERRRGVSSVGYLRFWAQRAGWPVVPLLRLRRGLRVATVVAYGGLVLIWVLPALARALGWS
ncbi:hypothetical protein [Oryzihumus sp.]|uniref:hypothetical protein n=1 Tax=Oryzihumus sp. TaxID=1968903 RepID=UPI002EDA548E